MFAYVKNDNGNAAPVIKEMKAAAATYAVGDALVADAASGALKICTGATKPQYISAAAKVVTEADNLLAVNPVYDGQEWKTQFSADASAVKEGTAVTIDAEGRKVTATDDGAFTILHKLSTGAAGTEVIGKFV